MMRAWQAFRASDKTVVALVLVKDSHLRRENCFSNLGFLKLGIDADTNQDRGKAELSDAIKDADYNLPISQSV